MIVAICDDDARARSLISQRLEAIARRLEVPLIVRDYDSMEKLLFSIDERGVLLALVLGCLSCPMGIYAEALPNGDAQEEAVQTDVTGTSAPEEDVVSDVSAPASQASHGL